MEILLFHVYHFSESSHLRAQELQLGKLEIKIISHLVLRKRVFAGHVELGSIMADPRRRSYNIRNPGGGNLLEADGQSNIRYCSAVDVIQIEVHRLLLSLAIQHHTCELPVGNDGGPMVEGESAPSTLWERVPIDGDIGKVTGII